MSLDLNGREREVIESLGRPGGVVEKSLRFLAKADDRKMWWPDQFFSFMRREDYGGELRELRDRARDLSDELLVVLVGNMVTEEALPNYSARLANLFPDETGVSTNPWNLWERGWNAEEDRHRRVLNQYLLLSGRVNMESVEKSIFSLIDNGFKQDPSLYKGVLYPAFQEPATRISHTNTRTRAEEQGDSKLSEMCRRIAGDEHRHYQFYLNVSKGIFNMDAEGAMISFYELMKEGIVMPACLMTDEVYTKPPTLFDHYADVAQSIEVYTAFDYEETLEELNEAFGISDRSVSGKAAKAQEGLMKLPSIIHRVGEIKNKGLENREKVPFSWIGGRRV